MSKKEKYFMATACLFCLAVGAINAWFVFENAKLTHTTMDIME